MTTWYVVLDKQTGDHISTGTSLGEGAAEKYEVIEFEQEKDPSNGMSWDTKTKSFVVDDTVKMILQQKVLDDPRLDVFTPEQKDILMEVIVEKFL